MTSSGRKSVPGLILLLFAGDAAIVLASIADWRSGGVFWRLTALLDLEGQGSAVTWYSSVQLFMIAVLLAGFARHARARAAKRAWLLWLPAAIFAVLSFEEIGKLHELFRYRSGRLAPILPMRNSPFYAEHIWVVIVGAPVAAVLLALGWILRRYLPRRDITVKYLLGLACFSGSGAAASLLARWLPPQDIWRAVAAAGNELGVLVGGTVMLWATYELVVAHAVPFIQPSVRSPGDRPVAAPEPKA